MSSAGILRPNPKYAALWAALNFALPFRVHGVRGIAEPIDDGATFVSHGPTRVPFDVTSDATNPLAWSARGLEFGGHADENWLECLAGTPGWANPTDRVTMVWKGVDNQDSSGWREMICMTSTGDRLFIARDSTNRFVYECGGVYRTNSAKIPKGVPYTVVACYDGVDMYAYINGKSVIDASGSDTPTGKNLWIGNYEPPEPEEWSGPMSLAAVFNTHLTRELAQQLSMDGDELYALDRRRRYWTQNKPGMVLPVRRAEIITRSRSPGDFTLNPRYQELHGRIRPHVNLPFKEMGPLALGGTVRDLGDTRRVWTFNNDTPGFAWDRARGLDFGTHDDGNYLSGSPGIDSVDDEPFWVVFKGMYTDDSSSGQWADIISDLTGQWYLACRDLNTQHMIWKAYNLSSSAGGTGAWTINKPFGMACFYDGARMVVFIDGKKFDDQAVTGTFQTGYTLRIGTWTGVSEFYDGSMELLVAGNGMMTDAMAGELSADPWNIYAPSRRRLKRDRRYTKRVPRR